MRVLIACEFSGIVRQAFQDQGHVAYSCDLLETDIPGNHYQCDVREVLHEPWDLLIAHPPCTYLASSGARWWPLHAQEQCEALAFVQLLLDAPVRRIALENPVGKISTAIRKPDQSIQPWHFGDYATKTTHLWLKNLPILQPTVLVWPRPQLCWTMSPSPRRAHERSRTFPGIAYAMASQWGRVSERSAA